MLSAHLRKYSQLDWLYAIEISLLFFHFPVQHSSSAFAPKSARSTRLFEFGDILPSLCINWSSNRPWYAIQVFAFLKALQRPIFALASWLKPGPQINLVNENMQNGHRLTQGFFSPTVGSINSNDIPKTTPDDTTDDHRLIPVKITAGDLSQINTSSNNGFLAFDGLNAANGENDDNSRLPRQKS